MVHFQGSPYYRRPLLLLLQVSSSATGHGGALIAVRCSDCDSVYVLLVCIMLMVWMEVARVSDAGQLAQWAEDSGRGQYLITLIQ